MNTALKNIFTAVLLTVFVFSAKAQDKNFHFGLKGNGGLYFAKSNDEVFKGDGAKLGLGFGLMLEFGFTSNYYFLTGAEINTISVKSKYEVTGSKGTFVSTVKYVELPLMLKMKTKEIGMMKYFGLFGFKTGLAVSAKNESSATILGVTTTTTDKKMDDIFPIRESLVIGGGAEYNLSGTTSLVFGISYDNGLTSIFKKKNSKISSVENPKMFSNGVVLTVGILF